MKKRSQHAVRQRMVFVVAMLPLFGLTSCLQWPVESDSRRPEQVLFERAMYAKENKKFEVAKLTLQTLINAYPDSEYAAKARLALKELPGNVEVYVDHSIMLDPTPQPRDVP